MSKVTKDIIKLVAEIIILLMVFSVAFDPERGILMYAFNYITYAEPLLLQHYIASMISTASAVPGEFFSEVRITGNPYELIFEKKDDTAYIGISTKNVEEYLIKTQWDKLDPIPVLTSCSFDSQYVDLEKQLSQVLYVKKVIEDGGCKFYIYQGSLSGGGTEGVCLCTDWIEQECGEGSCSQAFMNKTRICNNHCDVESVCGTDPDCTWFDFDMELNPYFDNTFHGSTSQTNVILTLKGYATKPVTLSATFSGSYKETINFAQNDVWYPLSKTPVISIENITSTVILNATDSINFVNNNTLYPLDKKYVVGIKRVFNSSLTLPSDQYEYTPTSIKLILTNPAFILGAYFVDYNYSAFIPPNQYKYDSNNVKLTLTDATYNLGSYDVNYHYSYTTGSDITFDSSSCEPTCSINMYVPIHPALNTGHHEILVTAKSDDLTKFRIFNINVRGCGDEVVEPPEQCDNTDLNGKSCIDFGFIGGTLTCNSDCTFNTNSCTGMICGNGIKEGTEQCDGTDLGGHSCTDFGFDCGNLKCKSDCTFDTSGCNNNYASFATNNEPPSEYLIAGYEHCVLVQNSVILTITEISFITNNNILATFQIRDTAGAGPTNVIGISSICNLIANTWVSCPVWNVKVNNDFFVCVANYSNSVLPARNTSGTTTYVGYFYHPVTGWSKWNPDQKWLFRYKYCSVNLIHATAILNGNPTAANVIVVDKDFHSMGDINWDGKIGSEDFIALSGAYGSIPGSPGWNPEADLNEDNIINNIDFIIFSGNSGKTASTYTTEFTIAAAVGKAVLYGTNPSNPTDIQRKEISVPSGSIINVQFDFNTLPGYDLIIYQSGTTYRVKNSTGIDICQNTNAGTAINCAIQSSKNGYRILLQAGSYPISTQINDYEKNQITFEGEGNSSEIVINGAIHGFYIQDQTEWTFRNFKIRGTKVAKGVTGFEFSNFVLINTSDFTIEKIWSRTANGYFVRAIPEGTITNNYRLNVLNNTCDDPGHNCLSSTNLKDSVIRFNTFYKVDYTLDMEQIWLGSREVSGQVFGCSNNLITQNTIIGGSIAFNLDAYTTAGGNIQAVNSNIISYNTITQNGGTDPSVYIRAWNNVFDHNTIIDTNPSRTTVIQLKVEGDTPNYNFGNNITYNNITHVSGKAISNYGGALMNSTISYNRIRGTPSGNLSISISNSASDYNTITYNVVRRTISIAGNSHGTSDGTNQQNVPD